jgi:hypothetical protein
MSSFKTPSAYVNPLTVIGQLLVYKSHYLYKFSTHKEELFNV